MPTPLTRLKNLLADKTPKLPPLITTSVFSGKRTAAYLRTLNCKPMADKPMSMQASRNHDGDWLVTALYHVPTMPFEMLPLEEKRIERTIAENTDAQTMLELLAGFEEAARNVRLGAETAPPPMSATQKFALACLGKTHIATVLQNPHHLKTARPNLFDASRLRKIRKGKGPG